MFIMFALDLIKRISIFSSPRDAIVDGFHGSAAFRIPKRHSAAMPYTVSNNILGRLSLDTLMQLFIPIFVHGDEYHLYYNMASLLMKGVALELRRGSESFAVLVASFVVANAFAFVALSYFTGWSFHACTVGFSGVLFL